MRCCEKTTTHSKQSQTWNGSSLAGNVFAEQVEHVDSWHHFVVARALGPHLQLLLLCQWHWKHLESLETSKGLIPFLAHRSRTFTVSIAASFAFLFLLSLSFPFLHSLSSYGLSNLCSILFFFPVGLCLNSCLVQNIASSVFTLTM